MDNTLKHFVELSSKKTVKKKTNKKVKKPAILHNKLLRILDEKEMQWHDDDYGLDKDW